MGDNDRTHWRIARPIPSTPCAVGDSGAPLISPLSIELTNGHELFFAKKGVPNIQIIAEVVQYIHNQVVAIDAATNQSLRPSR